MELIDTVELMCSSDDKNRLKAEYEQNRIRIENLQNLILDYRDKKLSFIPRCPLNLLIVQLSVMQQYESILEQRMKFEEVE